MVEDEQARQSYTYCVCLLHCFSFNWTSGHIHTLSRNLTILDIQCRLCHQDMPPQGTLLKPLKRVFNHTLEQGHDSTGQSWAIQPCVCHSRLSLPETKRVTHQVSNSGEEKPLVPGRNPEQDQSQMEDPPANDQPGNGRERHNGCIMNQTIDCINCKMYCMIPITRFGMTKNH